MRTILPSGKQPWSRWHHRLHQLLLDDPSLLPQGSGLLIAISGGQDSLALTRLLLDLREQHHWQLQLWHGNHNWRQDAAANAQHLQQVAAQWGLPLTVDCAEPAPKSEAAARQWRYERLQRQAETSSCPLVLTGHTATDRAETLLFNLIRGADLTGLSSLRQTRPLGAGITVVRPLLAFSRADTQACCEQLGLLVWHDITNADRQFSRNRLRLDVIPELEALNPGATQHLARAAQLLEELEGQHSALEALALEAIRSEPGRADLNRQRWQEQPIKLQKRLLHRWVQQTSQQQLSAALTTEIWRQLQKPGRRPPIALSHGWQLQAEACMLKLIPPAASD
ncbi:tRNA(Ile)-lysidine synthase [Synechococcus sp. RCC307]|nr:tRNA(Ile)-lysidine synthase [Synechococcus sp. RCC307]